MWIQTATGRRFDLMDPSPNQVYAEDIIAALPFIPCFTGQQEAGRHDFAYSVAQYCLLVSHLARPELALDGLLHDAWKAYVGDLSKPFNISLNLMTCGQFGTFRIRLQKVVAARFGLKFPLPDEVEKGDMLARATELRDIMAPVPEPWSLELPEPISETITPLAPRLVRQEFAARWKQLASV